VFWSENLITSQNYF